MDYRMTESVKAKIKRFVGDKEVFDCLDNLFKAIEREETNGVMTLLDNKELPIDKSLKEMAYKKGRRDMLKRVDYYLYNWEKGIRDLEKREKEKKENESKK